jgi:SAM-dependent methyltransferase
MKGEPGGSGNVKRRRLYIIERGDKVPTISEKILIELLPKGTDLKMIEPSIYTTSGGVKPANEYDSFFGNVYDMIACSAVYNRLVWGYSIGKFPALVEEALKSSKTGPVLDVGCGSLAFTAKTYIQYTDRSVVFVDQSLKMLRMAKDRLLELNGRLPDNVVFLHADALDLPFEPNSFSTVIALNLLHCLKDTSKLLVELKENVSEGGKMYFSTLVKGRRYGDKYLKALADRGKLVSRSIADHKTVFNQLGLSARYAVNGNMAFIYCY